MPVHDMLTIAEAAKQFNVTRQRLHALIRDYGVATVRVTPRLLLVPKSELKKIPKDRPNGVRKDFQKNP